MVPQLRNGKVNPTGVVTTVADADGRPAETHTSSSSIAVAAAPDTVVSTPAKAG
jgi:hypothetical protein